MYDIQANKVSLKPITLFHVNKKQVEVFRSSSLRSGSRTSCSLLPTLTSDYLCSLKICVSFVCLSLSMPKSKGRLKLFSSTFHIVSLRRTVYDFGHSNLAPMSHVFSCWFFTYAELKEELRCPWSSKRNRLVLIRTHPRWTPRKNKHWLVNCLLLLLHDYSVLAFIFVWQLRSTLNTCLELQCPMRTHFFLVALNFNAMPSN